MRSRALAILLFLASVAAAIGNETVLVTRAPEYHVNDAYIGYVYSIDGERFQMRQYVDHDKDGLSQVHSALVHSHGGIIAVTVANPRTFEETTRGFGITSTTVETNCSPLAMYPIILGRNYSCTSTLEIDGKRLMKSQRMEFNEIERGPQYTVTGFCYRRTEDDGNIVMRSRVCMTPDGKWVRSVQVLEVARLTGA